MNKAQEFVRMKRAVFLMTGIISFLVNVAIYLFILIHLIFIFLGKEEYL